MKIVSSLLNCYIFDFLSHLFSPYLHIMNHFKLSVFVFLIVYQNGLATQTLNLVTSYSLIAFTSLMSMNTSYSTSFPNSDSVIPPDRAIGIISFFNFLSIILFHTFKKWLKIFLFAFFLAFSASSIVAYVPRKYHFPWNVI